MIFKHKMKTIVSLLLVFTITIITANFNVFSATPREIKDTSTVPVFDVNYPKDAEKIAENDRFQMYIEKEKYNIAIVDKKIGFIWYTSPPKAQVMEQELSGIGRQMAASQLYVTYINTKSRTTGSVNSQLGSTRQSTAELSQITNGVRIVYDFSRSEESFKIPVEFTLTDKGMDARIDFKNIKEYGECLVTEITLLPNFGVALKGEKGYILIPDGSGSIINFDSAKASSKPYSQPLYGNDIAYSMIQKSAPIEDVYLPVFGMSREKSGFTAFIDKGPALATINAFSSGKGSELNYVNASFSYRGIDNAVLSDASWISKNVVLFAKKKSTLEQAGISYRLLENNSLVGMADEYRNYLIDTKGLQRLANSETTLFTELYGGVQKKKSYFGFILNTIVPMTSFSEAQEILNALNIDGVDQITVKYNGVLKGGLDNSAVIDTKLEGALGGNKGFQTLTTFAASKNMEIYPDFEFQTIYKSRFMWWSFMYAAKMLSQSPITLFKYKESTYFRDFSQPPAYLMSPDKLKKEVKSFNFHYNLKGAAGISTGTMGSLLYSNFGTKNFFDRQMSAENITDTLKELSQNGKKLLVNAGFDYAAMQADRLFAVPMSDSMFDISYTRVPFYAMVLHGYKQMGSKPINMTEDPWFMFLNCIENGINPSFTFTYKDNINLQNTNYNFLISTNYRQWLDIAADYYKKFKDVFKGTVNQAITDYKILSEDVRVVSYENGLVICVNYSSKPYIYKNITVEANNYAIIQKA
jgi:hypothetical protein